MLLYKFNCADMRTPSCGAEEAHRCFWRACCAFPVTLNTLCRAHCALLLWCPLCPAAVVPTCQADGQTADIHCISLSIFKIKEATEEHTYVQLKICQVFSLLLPLSGLHSLGAKIQNENFNSKSMFRTLHLKE